MKLNYLLGAVAALSLSVVTNAAALTWTSNLEYQGTNGASATPYGVVTVEDGINYGKTVQVTVSLTNKDSLFINTGGPHEPFLYNVTSPTKVEIVNAAGQNFYDGGRSETGAFQATPFGSFTNKIGCCGDWVEDQKVVSGSHFELESYDEKQLVGYEIKGYEIKGYEIKSYEIKGYELTGYAQKVDDKGKPVFDKKGQPVYDKDKPIYDTSKPIYDYKKPIYDKTKPVYDTSKPIYDESKPIYKTETKTRKVKVLEYTNIPGHWDEENGASHGIKGPLVFFLNDDNGLTFAGLNFSVDPKTGKLQLPLGTGNHLFSNDGGWWFSADIYDGATGKTYNVAARDAVCAECVTHPSTAIPEPDAWTLMILGFGSAGALLRRQRRFAAI